MVKERKSLLSGLYGEVFYAWHFGIPALFAYEKLRIVNRLSRDGKEISSGGRTMFYNSKSKVLLYRLVQEQNEKTRERLEKKHEKSLVEATDYGGLAVLFS